MSLRIVSFLPLDSSPDDLPMRTYSRPEHVAVYAAVAAVLLLAFPVAGADAKLDAAGVEFFEKKVRPVLAANCFSCHSVGKKRRGNLLLDSRAALLKGGDTGAALVPGEPAKSLLIKAISYTDELRMPPRSKLAKQQIDDLMTWVRMGAPWPGGGSTVAGPQKFDFEQRRKHWSFQPVRKSFPPVVKRASWPGTPVDRFLLARLEETGLNPAPEADRRTLLRRVTYDLTGLPPTKKEITAFLDDHSPGAWERVVDRLLASPAYGERWGRHWLDLVRFAETSGHEFDFEIANAWRYREHIIRAFNDDVPYDRIVQEHIAGDLLPAPRRHPVERTNESILATGFWFLGESKHSPVDVRADGSDRRDNMIDVFGKTFLGLTIACARCHDHKFDPIYTRDYYALAGYLQSSRMQQAFLDEPDTIGIHAKKVRELRAEAGSLAVRLSATELEKQFAGLSDALLSARSGKASTFAQALKKTAAGSGDSLFGPWHVLGEPSFRNGADFLAKKRELAEQMRAAGRQAAEASKRTLAFADFRKDGYRDWFVTGHAFGDSPATLADVEVRPGSPIPVRRLIGPCVASSGLVSGKLQGAIRSRTFTIDKKHILYRARGSGVRINVIIDGYQQIREPIYGGLTFAVNENNHSRWYVQNVGMWIGLNAYIEVLDDGQGAIELERILFSDSGPPPDPPNPLLLGLVEDPAVTSADALAKAYQKLVLQTVELWRDGKLAGRDDVHYRVELLNAILASDAIAALGEPGASATRGTAECIDRLANQLQAIAAAESAIPTPRRGLALTDGTGINECVFIRGNHKTPGEEAPRQLPVLLAGDPTSPTRQRGGSGRLEMALRLTSLDNPLLARVLVNRLWHHHFGAGIVRSVDDFGHQGDRPTHPELLDWLAAEFMRSGWSIKHMQRLMVLSSAYRMVSRSDEASERDDPRNELLHRMLIRRLEAESLRDAMLAVSGRLDRRMFGRGPLPHLTPFTIGRGRPASGPLDGDGRRSVYLNVRRNFLNPMFVAFDYPTPFTTMGRRSVSNVPAQALTLLNNPFVMQQAHLWARRVLAEPGQGDRERIARMYETGFGRLPTDTELDEALVFLAEQGKEYGRIDERAWADLAHVLFNVKEFIFVN
jgi:hypothetical protein